MWLFLFSEISVAGVSRYREERGAVICLDNTPALLFLEGDHD